MKNKGVNLITYDKRIESLSKLAEDFVSVDLSGQSYHDPVSLRAMLRMMEAEDNLILANLSKEQSDHLRDFYAYLYSRLENRGLFEDFSVLDYDQIVDTDRPEEELAFADGTDARLRDLKAFRYKDGGGKFHVVSGERAIAEFRRNNPGIVGEETTVDSIRAQALKLDIERYAATGDQIPDIDLPPDLRARYEKDPRVRGLVDYTRQRAVDAGLNPNMMATQFWIESRYDPNAGSPMGARGIAQIMPFHVGKYGLRTAADFLDPITSINAGIQIMQEARGKYKGHQIVAAASYNAGGKIVESVARRLGKPATDVTDREFLALYFGDVRRMGLGRAGSWRGETFPYTLQIAGLSKDPYKAMVQLEQRSANREVTQPPMHDSSATGKPIEAPAQPVTVPAAANGAGGNPAQTPPTAAAGKSADKPAVTAASEAAKGITAAPPVGNVAPLGTVAANGAANNPDHKPQEPQVA